MLVTQNPAHELAGPVGLGVVEQLGAEEVQMASQEQMVPVRKFLRNCKRSLKLERVVDSAGTKLTGGGVVGAEDGRDRRRRERARA